MGPSARDATVTFARGPLAHQVEHRTFNPAGRVRVPGGPLRPNLTLREPAAGIRYVGAISSRLITRISLMSLRIRVFLCCAAPAVNRSGRHSAH